MINCFFVNRFKWDSTRENHPKYPTIFIIYSFSFTVWINLTQKKLENPRHTEGPKIVNLISVKRPFRDLFYWILQLFL